MPSVSLLDCLNCRLTGWLTSTQLIKSIALLPALFAALATAVRPVEVRGQDFVVTGTDKRLMIIGVD